MAAATVLASTLAACADPYYPRYGYSQSYAYSSGPAVAVTTYYPAPTYYSYPSSSYGYNSYWDYYRNYRGIHAGPENFP
jgi:hypothetical protein